MVLAKWAGRRVQSGCICHFSFNSINTSVVAAVRGNKMSMSVSVNPCAHVYAQMSLCVPAHVHTGAVCVLSIERRWLCAGVHTHVRMHGLTQILGTLAFIPLT